jgi:predicted ATP-grasp superfamily ATP-dependent carboligase
MAGAATADFAQIPACKLVTTRDSRLAPFHGERCDVHLIDSLAAERTIIERLAASADWTLLIAPESSDRLAERARWVLDAGGRLLSPGLNVIHLTSDKQALCDHLRRAGVRTPVGCLVRSQELAFAQPPQAIKLPAVLKPNDGCGSLEVRRIDTWGEAHCVERVGSMRLEEFVAGEAASVAVLCGRGGLHPLPACAQQLSDDGRFA